MPTTIFNVAHHILKRNKKFDLLQLIKLCYLSYGWYLAYHDEPLFKEKIEAWKYGPVIPELYYALKHFGGQQLPINCLENLVIEDREFMLPENAKDLIDAVLDYYGKYSGIELSALTHKSGTPWDKTYGDKKQPVFCIPNSEIKTHFDELRKSS